MLKHLFIAAILLATAIHAPLSAQQISVLSSSPVQPGELDPSQQSWFEHYKKQPNIPSPEEMLINTDQEPDLRDGFSPLFNGKDLSGWTSRGGESTFEVVDGCIVSTCKPDSPSTYLCTEKDDYGDFILTFETMFEVETNSGIMLRAQTKDPDNNTVFGPQVEMEPDSQDREWSGGIYGQSCGGWFYPLWLKEHEDVRKSQKKGDWNRVTILARGPVIKTWLNGVPAAHWTTDTYLKGFFGLQMHKGAEGRVLWRNLNIKTSLTDASKHPAASKTSSAAKRTSSTQLTIVGEDFYINGKPTY